MAEKEERILGDQMCFYFAVCPRKDTPKLALGMTRTEAINRMAKVLRKKLFKNEGPTQKIKEQGLEKEYYEYVDFCCTYIAEAALNALLSK